VSVHRPGRGLTGVKARRRAPGYHDAMSTRTIIKIDSGKCNGCGLCIPNCPEGALQVIDGKARLISDLFCDGLGACVGYCPEGAITLEQRTAEPYDERRVMANIVPQGANTLRAHLEHLDSHGQAFHLGEALAYMKEKGVAAPDWKRAEPKAPRAAATAARATAASALENWPIQLHLLSPMAPAFRGRDVLLSADCVAHVVPDFHGTLLAGKVLAIACPKLDDGREIYQEKITALADHAGITSLTVAMMEVPCCRGLLAIAQAGLQKAHRAVPLKAIIVSIDGGTVLAEQDVPVVAAG
jgi:ferredoxin